MCFPSIYPLCPLVICYWPIFQYTNPLIFSSVSNLLLHPFIKFLNSVIFFSSKISMEILYRFLISGEILHFVIYLLNILIRVILKFIFCKPMSGSSMGLSLFSFFFSWLLFILPWLMVTFLWMPVIVVEKL